jgi:hypothetical protein
MIYIRDGKRINIYAPAIISGVQYRDLISPAVQHSLGITTVNEPPSPEDYSEDTYYRVESSEAPYVIYEKKPLEQILGALLPKYEAALDSFLDSKAVELGFPNGRYSAISRCGYSNPWQQQAIQFGTWMDQCNELAWQWKQAVLGGEMELESTEAMLAKLPEFKLSSGE